MLEILQYLALAGLCFGLGMLWERHVERWIKWSYPQPSGALYVHHADWIVDALRTGRFIHGYDHYPYGVSELCVDAEGEMVSCSWNEDSCPISIWVGRRSFSGSPLDKDRIVFAAKARMEARRQEAIRLEPRP